VDIENLKLHWFVSVHPRFFFSEHAIVLVMMGRNSMMCSVWLLDALYGGLSSAYGLGCIRILDNTSTCGIR
jgi:hypothetical protein